MNATEFDWDSLRGKSIGPDGRYLLEDCVGRGATSIVFSARDRVESERVAIKFFRPLDTFDAEHLQRFTREVRRFSRLDHPAIVRMRAMGLSSRMETGSRHLFLVGEFVVGMTLARLLAQRTPFEMKEILRIATAITGALAYLHREGVIHRDLKPPNIMIEDPGRNVRILDFGIAKDLNASTVLTRPGRVWMTPGYAAPEQLRGEEIDGRADLYSLGAVLFELLTGRVPGRDGVVVAVDAARVDAERGRGPAGRAGAEIADLVAGLLANRREDRIASADLVALKLAQTAVSSSADAETLAVVRRILCAD